MMECELDIGGDGEPIADFQRRLGTYDSDTTCAECERTIPKGTEHEVATGELDGGPFEAHTCMDCHFIAAGLQTEGRDYGFLWPQLEEHGGEDGGGAFEQMTTACLPRIETASAKAYLMERYRRWKDLSPRAETPVQRETE